MAIVEGEAHRLSASMRRSSGLAVWGATGTPRDSGVIVVRGFRDWPPDEAPWLDDPWGDLGERFWHRPDPEAPPDDNDEPEPDEPPDDVEDTLPDPAGEDCVDWQSDRVSHEHVIDPVTVTFLINWEQGPNWRYYGNLDWQWTGDGNTQYVICGGRYYYLRHSGDSLEWFVCDGAGQTSKKPPVPCVSPKWSGPDP